MKQQFLKWLNTFSIFFLVAALVVSVSLITVTQQANAAWDGSISTSFASGTGTETNPYIIKTESQLGYFLSQLSNGVHYEGIHIRLTSDLDMTGNTWTSGYFSGVFDGYGHTITADCSFLNRLNSSGTVKRLIYVVPSTVTFAPLIKDDNNGLIESCVVLGDVYNNDALQQVGMLCSSNYGTIRNCGAIGSVYGHNDSSIDIGMVGLHNGITMEHCYSALSVKGYASGKYSGENLGPLYGRNYTATTVITDCYYNADLFTDTTNQGIALSTMDMTDESFTDMMNSSLYTGCYWVQSPADSIFGGYPIPTVCYEATTYLEYTSDKTATYHTETLETSLIASDVGTIYYTLDGSDPITSPTRETYTDGDTITLSGHVTVRSVVYHNGEYSAVNTQNLIQLLGEGTDSDPYRIYDKLQLDALRLDLTASYMLMNDFTFTEDDYASDGIAPGGWTPFANQGIAFTGTFDGGGHAITGLRGSQGGLFHANNGTIQNLRIVDHRLYDSYLYGAVANSSSGSVIRCYTKSAFTLDDLPVPDEDEVSAYAGGVVGSGSAEYCWNDGLVYATSTYRYNWLYAGGIVGSGTASHCYNTGTVVLYSSVTTEYAYIGGIASRASNITNCRNDGSIRMSTSLDYDQFAGDISTGANATKCVIGDYESRISSSTGMRSTYYDFSPNPIDCYRLSPKRHTDWYPALNFETDWMMTENGPIPQGIMHADGTCPTSQSMVEPTCTENGSISYVDARTGAPLSTWTIPALDHTYNGWTPIADSDLHTSTCSFRDCGYVETVPHGWKVQTTVAPTCTRDGYSIHTCTCTAQKTVTVVDSMLDHIYTTYTTNNDATCFADGTKTAKCDYGCGTEDTLSDPGSQLTHSFTAYVSNGDAACTVDGTKTAECDHGCGTTDTLPDEGSMLGHSHTSSVTLAATCTQPGIRTYTCACGDIYTEEIAATGHSLTQVEAKSPTCLVPGYDAYAYCSVCDHTTYQEISATGHSLIQVDHKAPTCTDAGHEAYEYCLVCDHTTYKEVAATGHSYASSVTISPTCTEEGIMTFLCHCGVSYTEEIAATGHSPLQLEAKVPTCIEAGYEAYQSCCICNTILSPQTDLPALGHNWNKPTPDFIHTCSRCFATESVDLITGNTVNGLSWTLTPSGVLTVSGTGECADPSSWQDYASLVNTLILERGITSLVTSAYAQLSNLTTLSLSETVTAVSPDTLNYHCPSLCSISVHSGNPTYSTYDNMLLSKDQSTLMLYPAGKTDSLYILPAFIKVLDSYAFSHCNNLSVLSLPMNLEQVHPYAFQKCGSLQNLFLDSSNPNFICDSNVALIRKADQALVYYCANNQQPSYTVPQGTREIASHAFSDATYLTSVAFPLSLERIHASAFAGCTGLTSITYTGTAECWQLVSVTEQENDALRNAVYAFGTADTLSGACGADLSWRLNLLSGELRITGAGEITSTPWPISRIRSIVLTDGIVSIPAHAFADCPNLSSADLPSSITVIGENAFFGCSELSVVHYNGSTPAWNRIAIADGNDYLLSAAISFTSSMEAVWNNGHDTLTLSGTADSDSIIIAAFYNTDGQMQFMKHFTGSEVETGVVIRSNSADLTQCHVKIMVLDLVYAPMDIAYSPDAT